MDRKAWIAVSLSVLGLIAWWWYSQATYGPYLRQQEELRQKQAEAAAAAAKTTATPGAAPVATPAPAVPPPPVMTAMDETLHSSSKKTSADYSFNNDTGGIEAVQLNLHFNDKHEPIRLNGDRSLPIGAIAQTPGIALGGFAMTADREHNVVTFTKRDPDGLAIEKKFSLPPNDSPSAPYVVNLEVTFTNTSAITLSRSGYFVSTGSATPAHSRDIPMYTRFDWSSGGRMSGHDVNAFNAGSFLWLVPTSPARDSITEPVADLEWTAVASQYFCTILSARNVKGASVWCTRFTVPGATQGPTMYGIKGAMGLPGFTVEPGKSLTQNFQIYAGPKEMDRLESLGQNEQAVFNFGWFGWFNFISRFLLWAMNGIHGVVGNYAAAIVILTLLIKTTLWPLQNKATNSMRRMSALSPKMTELREKYKDDPQKMNEELMKLYRDYGVNPLASCLPMLIQIPIFFGFYSMLGSAIELRNSSFFWIHDLSQPDTVATIMGIPINVLPIIMAGTMIWQMAISPKSGDVNQQRMLMFMPVIFLTFAYNYASALSLYWTTQNLFSIVQLYLTRNKPLPVLEKVAVARKRKSQAASPPRKKRPT